MTTRLTQEQVIPARNDVGALGNRINLETRSCHDKIDKLVTLKFAVAVRDPKVYRQGMQMFYHIFKAIEETLAVEMGKDNKYAEMLRAIWKPALARTDPLYSDCMFFYDDHPEKFSCPILKGQIAAVQHIKEVCEKKPYLLLAYMHVLYLALFAGGRIMASQVTKSLKLFPQVEGRSFEEVSAMGTNLFKFEVEDPMALRAIYKRDYELRTRNFLSESEKREVIEESKYAFEVTAAGVKELERHNLSRLQSKLSYQIITKGYFVVLALLTLFAVWFVRRLILHLLF